EVTDLDELDHRESPLLLHPLRGEDPALHLEFDDLGCIRARDGSPLGQHSIEVFDLWREELNDDRRKQIALAKDAVLAALTPPPKSVEDFARAIEPWTGIKALFSAALSGHVARRVAEDAAQKRMELDEDVAQKEAELEKDVALKTEQQAAVDA